MAADGGKPGKRLPAAETVVVFFNRGKRLARELLRENARLHSRTERLTQDLDRAARSRRADPGEQPRQPEGREGKR